MSNKPLIRSCMVPYRVGVEKTNRKHPLFRLPIPELDHKRMFTQGSDLSSRLLLVWPCCHQETACLFTQVRIAIPSSSTARWMLSCQWRWWQKDVTHCCHPRRGRAVERTHPALLNHTEWESWGRTTNKLVSLLACVSHWKCAKPQFFFNSAVLDIPWTLNFNYYIVIKGLRARQDLQHHSATETTLLFSI